MTYTDEALATQPTLVEQDDTKRLDWIQLHIDSALTRPQIDIAMMAMIKQKQIDENCSFDIGN